MHKSSIALLLTFLTLVGPSAAVAETEAREAYEAGKAAFQAGELEQARDLFLKAAGTDPRNPDIWLWLGKAHYQLGAVAEAMAAWQRTIQLAPGELYARKMLKALRGELVEPKTRVSLIEQLLREKLYAAARSESTRLLTHKPLDDATRAQVLICQAEALVGLGENVDGYVIVQRTLLRYPRQADQARGRLLMARVRLGQGGRAAVEAIEMLNALAADKDNQAVAAAAAYELLAFELRQATSVARVEALAKWLADNPTHRLARDARQTLFARYLAMARWRGRPDPDAQLSNWDRAALAMAAQLYRHIAGQKDAYHAVTKPVLEHAAKAYAAHKAHRAAAAMVEGLLDCPLPRGSRHAALRSLAGYRTEVALEQLTADARAGKLTGALPDAIRAVLGVYDQIENAAPGTSTVDLRTALAARVRALAQLMPWPSKAAERTTPYRWSVDILLAAVKPGGDRAAVARAVAAATAAIRDAAATFQQKDVRGFALTLSNRLLAALPQESELRKGAMLHHVELLNVYALAGFNDNVRDGQRDRNASLTEQQKALIAALGRMVERKWMTPDAAVARLRSHLRAWVSAGHYPAAEQACDLLAQVLPPEQRRQARLLAVTYWIDRATREHRRLQSAGLTVPDKLDPTLAKALVECYVLQAGLEERDAFARRVRGVWDGVIQHYRMLEYYDAAAEAAATAPDKPVDAPRAYAYAQRVQADLKYEHAHRELARLLQSYKATDELKLTEGFRDALAAYRKFLSDRPSDPMAAHAVARVLAIAQVYEGHKAFDVAAAIYQDFAAFAAGIKPLSQAPPGAASVAEQARFAVARAMNAKADHALARQLADRRPDAPPPAELSEEFAAAIRSYRGFLADYPRSVLTATAIRNIKGVALAYVKADGWDVAGRIYADLLQGGLQIDHPEEIELLRGLCELGKAMPAHARELITSLTLPPQPEKPKGPKGRPARQPHRPDGGRFALAPGGDDLDDALRKLRTRHAEPSPPPSEGATGGDVKTLNGSAKVGAAASPADEESAEDFLREGDAVLIAALRRQEQNRSTQIARLRESLSYRPVAQGEAVAARRQPILSDAELARQDKAIQAAYEIFQDIRKRYAKTRTAEQARSQIMVMIGHWRRARQWQRAAELARRFLKDNPTDREVPQIRLAIARDYLALAAQPVQDKPSKQEMLAEVARRFEEARAELRTIVRDFSKDNKPLGQQAQWDIAQSFLTQARVVDAFSRTLARGQFVRAARELRDVARAYHDHPNISQIPAMLWSIATELSGRGYHEEAIIVWNDLTIHYPTHALAQQASMRIAETYHSNLRRPLRAAETYLEINHARGGSDLAVQNVICQIGAQLKSEKRWIEALHVLGTFVDSFPRHPQAGQALTMVGQIHQANEAWQDAIAAYERVIKEFAGGGWVAEAKWSVAECRINLSQWRTAMRAYRDFSNAYPKDARASEAARRIGILKDLARYQDLVDEEGQRKAFDAQFQIARIVRESLGNPVKSIIEYRKVAASWPESHLADDALYNVGTTYLSMTEIEKGRQALLELAHLYPGSPLADDALFLVGKSYEDESRQLAGVTRSTSLARNEAVAQKLAYAAVAAGRRKQRDAMLERIAEYKKAGKDDLADQELARGAAQYGQYNIAGAAAVLQQAKQQVETLTAMQLADRQDKINAALRKAVGAYQDASQVASADKAGDALLRMATIYDAQLKDPEKAMATWEEIVRQFSGTSVAEDASWRIAQYYEHHAKYDKAVEAYMAFLRNYRRSARAAAAQFAVAECYEHLSKWVQAMDAYTNYIKNFPKGPMVSKAREQINWIRTYRL
jgi:TolA-binding protein